MISTMMVIVIRILCEVLPILLLLFAVLLPALLLLLTLLLPLRLAGLGVRAGWRRLRRLRGGLTP